MFLDKTKATIHIECQVTPRLGRCAERTVIRPPQDGSLRSMQDGVAHGDLRTRSRYTYRMPTTILPSKVLEEGSRLSRGHDRLRRWQ